LAGAGISCNQPVSVEPDGGSVVGACTDALGQLRPAGKTCRPAAGPCDAEEVCTGDSPDCPPDALEPATKICRDRAGECDLPDACSGTSAQCPEDKLLPEGAVCRPSAGPCDPEERCLAGSVSCPADRLLSGDNLCRGAVGDCDEAEWCTGTSADCPADRLLPAGSYCRGEHGGLCDFVETCTGSDPQCPADGPQPAGFVCEDDQDLCTLDVCGSGAAAGTCTHPTAPDGTSCQWHSFCQAGACSMGCLIAGVFFENGKVNPLQPCQFCDPLLDPTGWSTNHGAACSGNGFCNGLVCEVDLENALWAVPPESPSDYQIDVDTVTDRVTGLLWQRVPSSTDMDFAQAQAHCSGLSLGGFASGWRMPALIELLSIVDSTATPAPTINLTAFPGTTATTFWSTTPVSTSPGAVWVVDFAVGGNEIEGGAAGSHSVRCVRSEPQALRPRYSVGTDTVKDELTGLTWERWNNPQQIPWASAEAYCQGLLLDGGGWRLPRKKELESLQDHRTWGQAINPDAFSVAPWWLFWTSTPYALSTGQKWEVGFIKGAIQSSSETESQLVRCVR
jgi:hypothetical protein